MSFINIALITVLLLALLTDISQRRIPNLLTVPSIFLGLIIHTIQGGMNGLLFSAGGMILGLGLLLFFYIFGMMGAGDVKLMAAVGSFLGPEGVFQAFIFTALAGGMYAVVVLLIKGRIRQFFKRIGLSFYLSIAQRKLTLLPDNEQKTAPVLCYAVAIATGTLVSLFYRF